MSANQKIPFMDLQVYHKTILDDVLNEIRALVDRSEFIGGKTLENFEQEFARYVGSSHAIGVSNGTDAITLTLRALHVGPGHEVITPVNTFIATAEAILAVGATPIFVDIDPKTALLDLKHVEAVITPQTKAIIPVHLYGFPINLSRLQDICKKHGLFLIQDSAQAHGARWKGQPLGAYGDAQTYSFYPGKNLGAWGDAGAVATSQRELAETIHALRNHGRHEKEKYLHDLVGGNDRMDPLQTIILSRKLPHLESRNEARRKLATQYEERLKNIGDLQFFHCEADGTPVYHLFVIRTKKREALQKHLASQGISTGIHYPVPLHLQPALKDLGIQKDTFPIAEALAGEILSLPFFPEMTEEQMDRVVAQIEQVFR